MIDPAVLAMLCCDAPLAPYDVREVAFRGLRVPLAIAKYRCANCGVQQLHRWVDLPDPDRDHEQVPS